MPTGGSLHKVKRLGCETEIKIYLVTKLKCVEPYLHSLTFTEAVVKNYTPIETLEFRVSQDTILDI